MTDRTRLLALAIASVFTLGCVHSQARPEDDEEDDPLRREARAALAELDSKTGTEAPPQESPVGRRPADSTSDTGSKVKLSEIAAIEIRTSRGDTYCAYGDTRVEVRARDAAGNILEGPLPSEWFEMETSFLNMSDRPLTIQGPLTHGNLIHVGEPLLVKVSVPNTKVSVDGLFQQDLCAPDLDVGGPEEEGVASLGDEGENGTTRSPHGKPGRPGKNGRNGKDGKAVVVEVARVVGPGDTRYVLLAAAEPGKAKPDQVLLVEDGARVKVRADGGAGEKGGAGGRGGRGHEGGYTAREDCAMPGDAGDGANGGDGGHGGRGGAVQVRAPSEQLLALIKVSASGGKGGGGGGAGAAGDAVEAHCGKYGNHKGRPGRGGSPGRAGTRGADGSVDTDVVPVAKLKLISAVLAESPELKLDTGAGEKKKKKK